MSKLFEKHIPVEQQNQTILQCLAEHLELSRQQLKRTMQNGAVWLETSHGIERVRRAKKILHRDEIIHLYFDERIQNATPPIAELIADEGDYSIWSKPSGMYSQGSKWGDHCTIYRWAEQHLQPQRAAFLVHRLDRAASGLMILAHKKSVAAKFSKMFEKHEIYKKYQARVEGIISDIELPFKINTVIEGKPAVSEIVTLNTDEDNKTTEVELVIKTGRKHQIRRQLAGLGHPIVGDRLYGAKNIEPDLQLSSVCLKFTCPVSAGQKCYELIKD